MPFNFLVSIKHLYFCSSVKNDTDLNLFANLWKGYPLGIFSQRNWRRNFRRRTVSDLILYMRLRECTLLRSFPCYALFPSYSWEQMENGADSCLLLFTNHKQNFLSWITLLTVKHNAIIVSSTPLATNRLTKIKSLLRKPSAHSEGWLHSDFAIGNFLRKRCIFRWEKCLQAFRNSSTYFDGRRTLSSGMFLRRY
jgi:hypothetical protein